MEAVQAAVYAGAKSRRDEWVAGRHTALGTPQEKFCGMTVGQGQQEGDAGVDGGESGGLMAWAVRRARPITSAGIPAACRLMVAVLMAELLPSS